MKVVKNNRPSMAALVRRRMVDLPAAGHEAYKRLQAVERQLPKPLKEACRQATFVIEGYGKRGDICGACSFMGTGAGGKDASTQEKLARDAIVEVLPLLKDHGLLQQYFDALLETRLNLVDHSEADRAIMRAPIGTSADLHAVLKWWFHEGWDETGQLCKRIVEFVRKLDGADAVPDFPYPNLSVAARPRRGPLPGTAGMRDEARHKPAPAKVAA